MTGPGNSTCSCMEGWVGDGTYCYLGSSCQLHSHCHENARCQQTTPGKNMCVCADNYHGNGTDCVPNNPCAENNGGCYVNGSCKSLGPGRAECRCPIGMGGDGYTCFGSVGDQVYSNPKLSKLASLLQRLPIPDDYLTDLSLNLTLLAPSDEALEAFMDLTNTAFWDDTANVILLLGYHTLPRMLSEDDLQQYTGQTISTMLTWRHFTLHITDDESKKLAINSAQILSADNPALNGIIHIIDKVLEPYPMTTDLPLLEELSNATSNYSEFLSQLKSDGLLNIVEGLDEYTVFVPLNEGWLNRPQFIPREYLEYYVVPYMLTTWSIEDGILQVETLLSNTSLSNHNTSLGQLTITVNNSQLWVDEVEVIIPDVMTDGGVVHVINDVLHPDQSLLPSPPHPQHNKQVSKLESNSNHAAPISLSVVGMLMLGVLVAIVIYRYRHKVSCTVPHLSWQSVWSFQRLQKYDYSNDDLGEPVVDDTSYHPSHWADTEPIIDPDSPTL